MKSRLAREHWALISERVERAKRNESEAGDMRSVGAKQALERLDNIVGVSVAPGGTAAVEAVEKLRNRTAHFALVGETRDGIRAAVGRGLHFSLSFLGEHVAPDAAPRERIAIEEFMEDVAPALGEIDELVRTRMGELTTRGSSAPRQWCVLVACREQCCWRREVPRSACSVFTRRTGKRPLPSTCPTYWGNRGTAS